MHAAASMSVEDRLFLEDFGRRIASYMGFAAIAGGCAAYGGARMAGFRRRGLLAALGATVSPVGTWYAVMMAERDKYTDIVKRIQAAAGQAEAEGGAPPGRDRTPQHSDQEVLARLF